MRVYDAFLAVVMWLGVAGFIFYLVCALLGLPRPSQKMEDRRLHADDVVDEMFPDTVPYASYRNRGG